MCQDRPVSEVEMDKQCLTMSLFWKYVGPQFTQSVTKSTLYRNKKCKSSATKTGWVSAWIITPIFKISFAQNRYFQICMSDITLMQFLMIHLCKFGCILETHCESPLPWIHWRWWIWMIIMFYIQQLHFTRFLGNEVLKYQDAIR